MVFSGTYWLVDLMKAMLLSNNS